MVHVAQYAYHAVSVVRAGITVPRLAGPVSVAVHNVLLVPCGLGLVPRRFTKHTVPCQAFWDLGAPQLSR